MSRVDVEICVNSRDPEYVAKSVGVSIAAGAGRIELCSDMHLDGLTPPQEHIVAARDAMGSQRGLLCMIRPRGGGFIYTPDEVSLMEAQIRMAAEAGSNGVVLGALVAGDHSIDQKVLTRLVDPKLIS